MTGTQAAIGYAGTIALAAVLAGVLVRRRCRVLSNDYESFLANLQPRVLNGSVWLLAAIAALILWYRLPVEPFHKAVLLGYVPYLIVFSLTINVLGALGRAGWERAWALQYVNQLAYLALLVHWARAAWRRVEEPVRPPGVRRRVTEPLSA